MNGDAARFGDGGAQAAAVAAFRDELARLGVDFAAISPGSRSAPLALALAADPRFSSHPVVDERSAGFVALGAGKATRRPALVVTTSGTAAANLTPSIHEAREARVPLIALTADRPPEMRGVGEGQTIDQVRLFGSAAHFISIDDPADPAEWSERAREAVEAATGKRPGPVQVNISLRPPLHDPIPASSGDRSTAQMPAPMLRPPSPAAAKAIASASRPLAVAGRDESGAGSRLASECERLGIPLLADPLSGASAAGTAIHAWEPILRAGGPRRLNAPDLIVRSGDMPTSRALRGWIAGLAAGTIEVIQFDPEDSHRDPLRSSSMVVDADCASTLAAIDSIGIDDDWLAGWLASGEHAQAAIAPALSGEPVLTEPAVAALSIGSLGPDDILFCSASMPIRDLESFAPVGPGLPRIVSNRGANGIDGVISTAIGMALASGRRTAVLIGDVALAHDQGALLLLRDLRPAVDVILLDNGGGAIFESLPRGAVDDAIFERFFTTPTGLDVAALCRAWDIPVRAISSAEDLRTTLLDRRADDGARLLGVELSAEQGRRARTAAFDAVSESLGD